MEIIKHPIKPQKEKAWHLYAHPYFTKQPSNVVSEYIKHYSKEGDTVFDPFCGTGVTAIEAIAMNRKVIMSDLNPLACFITEQTIKKISISDLIKEFNKIETSVSEKIIAVDELTETEASNLEIPYWHPKNILLPKNSDIKSIEQLWTKKQLFGLSTLWHEIIRIKNKEIKEQMKYIFSATVSRVNITFHDSYKEMEDKSLKKINGGSVSILSHYRYWTPKRIVALPVWKSFLNRFKLILRAKEKWNEITNKIDVNSNYKIINCSVLDIAKHVKPNTIDYIYTDPPYGGNIAYLDLSTMWNAWLGFKVTKENKQDEIIEGGDLDKSQENYEDLFSQSFKVMGSVLKKDGWMSLVFAHKKLEFWNTIIDSSESNGLEFKGSTFQPTNNSSIHFKKNPSNVLCSQRIANFKKTFQFSKIEKTDDVKNYILNEIERSCLETRGASIDRIYQRVLDKLLDNKMIYEAKKKGYLNLDKFLLDTNLFVFEPDTGLYYVKDSNKPNEYERDYFKHKDEIKLYLQSMLKTKRSMTIDQIHKELFELYSEEKKFPIAEKDVNEILKDIAHNHKKTGKWVLNNAEQIGFGFEEVVKGKLIRIDSKDLSHSEVIYRLHIIGNYLGFKSFIGKKEQATEEFNGIKFSTLSDSSISMKEFDRMDKAESSKIMQIDLIWLDKFNNPRYAFEVEESTSIISAFDRFTNLLKADHSISRNLFIVLPRKREKTFNDRLKTSQYIGHPIYLEQKMKYIYKEDLKKFYDEHVEKSFDELDLKKIFVDIEI